MFTRLDATNIPLNKWIQHRICGDAFILRINELKCKAENVPDHTKFHLAVYEDVPKELVDCNLLREILMPRAWKVLEPHPTIVRLGFIRAQIKQKQEEQRIENEEKMEEKRKERTLKIKERLGLRQRKIVQEEKDTKEGEEKVEQKQGRKEQMEKDRRDRKVKKRLQDEERKEEERQERERNERERQKRERQEWEWQQRERLESEMQERERQTLTAYTQDSVAGLLNVLPDE